MSNWRAYTVIIYGRHAQAFRAYQQVLIAIRGARLAGSDTKRDLAALMRHRETEIATIDNEHYWGKGA